MLHYFSCGFQLKEPNSVFTKLNAYAEKHLKTTPVYITQNTGKFLLSYSICLQTSFHVMTMQASLDHLFYGLVKNCK